MIASSADLGATEPPFVIASMFPGVLNTNGDAANARVLARRATWAGVPGVRLVEVQKAGDLPEAIDVLVVGACGDADRDQAHAALLTVSERLGDLVRNGVPLLAVATGWELLSQSFTGPDGTTTVGLGIFSGKTVPRMTRVSDDLVIDSQFGKLVGYENHSSNYVLGTGEAPLGRVLHGIGNGDSASTEGVISGHIIGTHLHGPVLAKNPSVADYLLAAALKSAGRSYANQNNDAREADQIALKARGEITTRLGLGD